MDSVRLLFLVDSLLSLNCPASLGIIFYIFQAVEVVTELKSVIGNGLVSTFISDPLSANLNYLFKSLVGIYLAVISSSNESLESLSVVDTSCMPPMSVWTFL